jgi:hypothetical protein
MLWFGGKRKAAPAARTRKRQQDRFSSDLLVCEYGDVLDLSGSGARLRCTGRVRFKRGQLLPLTLGVPDGKLTLKSRVVRVERRGLRAHEVAFEFIGVTPRVARALKCLAQFGFVDPAVAFSSGNDGAAAAGPAGGAAPAGVVTPEAPPKVRRARQVLGVDEFATADDLQRAYHKLALCVHPDVRPGPGAEERFVEITEAYRTLRAALRVAVAT